MKKIRIFTLILAAVCLCTLLASCTQESNCAHEYDNECDSECNICSEKRTALSHLWHSVDQELCQYKQTCAWCGLTMGENVEHSYIDEDGNVLDECVSCGNPNPITAQNVLQIAKEHFYSNYAEDGDGFSYSEGMGTVDGGNYKVYFKKLYESGKVGNVYYYSIDKASGEILEISIMEESLKNEATTTSRFMYTYAYFHIHDTLTGKAYATLLCDDSYIHIGAEKPLDITAGDMLIVEHTGYFRTQETYPGSTYLYNGEVISYRFEYSTVYTLLGEEVNSVAVRNQYDFRWGDYYVILNRKGDFVSLDEYEGDTLYLVLDKQRAEKLNKDEIQESWNESKIPIACALAYNPRDLGEINDMPEKLEPITEQEAKDIASAHFYNDSTIYPLPDGYAYKAITVEGVDASCHYVLFDPEYLGEPYEQILFDHFTYLYKVNKITGEIVDISSDF